MVLTLKTEIAYSMALTLILCAVIYVVFISRRKNKDCLLGYLLAYLPFAYETFKLQATRGQDLFFGFWEWLVSATVVLVVAMLAYREQRSGSSAA